MKDIKLDKSLMSVKLLFIIAVLNRSLLSLQRQSAHSLLTSKD